MATTEQTNSPADTANAPSELESLKQQADLLGIPYHANIGVTKLKEKIAASLSDGPADEPEPEAEEVETDNQRRRRIKKHMMELVRVRITCMNPQKKEYQGELISVANKVASARRMVPFNVEWHIERCLYTQMKAREYTVFYTEKTSRGMSVRKAKTAKEFAIEVLPPLTPQELAELAQRQAMANGTATAA